MIKIIIVDDQPLVREGLATILQMQPSLEVVGTAEDGSKGFELTKLKKPDLVLMDIRMPGTNGVEGTRLITNHCPETKVLILTTFKDQDLIVHALEEGASGYLLKDMPTDTIVQAIRTVIAGGWVLPPIATLNVLYDLKEKGRIKEGSSAPDTLSHLTNREIEVLQYLGKGLNNREIADKLYITEGTVKNHVSNIISKLYIRDRTQAAIFAVRYGITQFTEK